MIAQLKQKLEQYVLCAYKCNVRREWINRVKNRYNEQVLTVQQIKAVKEYFKPYFDINPAFHNFYTKKTGKFELNYLPDDMYYSAIDQYYNNWYKAVHIDDKSLYNRLLGGGCSVPGEYLLCKQWLLPQYEQRAD
jgi:hypothetical protein